MLSRDLVNTYGFQTQVRQSKKEGEIYGQKWALSLLKMFFFFVINVFVQFV